MTEQEGRRNDGVYKSGHWHSEREKTKRGSNFDKANVITAKLN